MRTAIIIKIHRVFLLPFILELLELLIIDWLISEVDYVIYKLLIFCEKKDVKYKDDRL